MKKVNKILLELDWVPPAVLRGNSRAGWRAKSREVRLARDLGRALGFRALPSGRISGNISVEVLAYYPRSIDLDNLLIGYKPFFDGLADSRLIDNDRNIKKMSIRLFNNKESCSSITIISMEPEKNT